MSSNLASYSKPGIPILRFCRGRLANVALFPLSHEFCSQILVALCTSVKFGGACMYQYERMLLLAASSRPRQKTSGGLDRGAAAFNLIAAPSFYNLSSALGHPLDLARSVYRIV